ncbi:MAG: transcriptional repressor LexA [Candidatus Onthomonas sp.]|nr:transcriptional repressor LexA [Candidatus Onthomonas sp.]
MKTLTAQQQKIYDFIVSYQAEYGFPPSVREIAGAVGLKSPSTVHFHLKALEEAGAISRGTGKTRAITATGSAQHINEVPLLGSVAAGAPILAEECVEEYLPFDTAGRSGEHFALRIRGESMIKAGILPGDFVVVRQQSTAYNGEIVIALIGDDATCKRLDRRSGHTWLLPENDDYEPIDGSEAVILGKVVGLIRRY